MPSAIKSLKILWVEPKFKFTQIPWTARWRCCNSNLHSVSLECRLAGKMGVIWVGLKGKRILKSFGRSSDRPYMSLDATQPGLSCSFCGKIQVHILGKPFCYKGVLTYLKVSWTPCAPLWGSNLDHRHSLNSGSHTIDTHNCGIVPWKDWNWVPLVVPRENLPTCGFFWRHESLYRLDRKQRDKNARVTNWKND